MAGLEAGDLAGWFGAVVGATSLGWQIFDRVIASSRIQRDRISARSKMKAHMILVSILWRTTDTHTSFQAEVTIRRPQNARLFDVDSEIEQVTNGFVSGMRTVFLPSGPERRRATFKMTSKPDNAVGSVFVKLDAPTEAFMLDVAIRDVGANRVVARRRLPMTLQD